MRDNLFLHFLNRDSREIYGLFQVHKDDQHVRLLRRALNASILLCEDHCIMPPGFVIEDEMAFGLAESQIDFLTSGILQFPMRESNIEDYAEKKRADYYPMRDRYSGLFNDDRLSFLGRNATGLIKRNSHISDGIVQGWRGGAEAGARAWKPVKRILSPSDIDSISHIPTQLSDDGVALTWSAIAPRLSATNREAANALRNTLQHTYFTQYCREFRLITLSGIPYMVEEFYLPHKRRSYHYGILQRYLEAFSLANVLLDASATFIMRLKNTIGYNTFFDAYIQLAEAAESKTGLYLIAARAAQRSGFDWSAFGLRHSSLLRVPGEVDVAELDHAMQEVADILTAEHGLETRSLTLAQPKPTVRPLPAAKAKPRTLSMTDLVVFVALEEELRALSDALGLKRLAGNGHRAEGDIAGTAVAVICPKDMGRVPAAVEVSTYLQGRSENLPRLLLVVGLAGGFPAEKTQPGHTICAEKVVDLARRKVIDEQDRTVTKFRRVDFDLDNSLRDVLQSDEFDQEAWRRDAEKVGNWPEDRRPSLHYGSLASGDEVVASNEWQAEILEHTEKLLGVEMEAGGVCAAAQRFRVPVSMLRVVSDSADPAKADDAWRRRGMLTLAELLKRLPLDVVLANIR